MFGPNHDMTSASWRFKEYLYVSVGVRNVLLFSYDNDNDDDELLLWNSWLTKGDLPYFQPWPL